jgi:hypothetical protein
VAWIGQNNQDLSYLGFHFFHLLMNALAVVALLVFGVCQSISGAWRGWASAGLNRVTLPDPKLCPIVRQHAQGVFSCSLFLVSKINVCFTLLVLGVCCMLIDGT